MTDGEKSDQPNRCQSLKKIVIAVVLATVICVFGLSASGYETISYNCSGDIHLVPVLKDKWKAYTSIS